MNKRINIYPALFIQIIPQGNQRVDEEEFVLVEIVCIISEDEMTKHHCRSPNEIVGLDNKHP